MSIRMTVALGLLSVGVLWSGLAVCQEIPAGPSIKLERAVHFLSPDGTDTVLASGVYGVEAKDEKVINVTAINGGETITIQAGAGTHEEQLSGPAALAVTQEEDLFHLVLLMPGGKTLDALGTFSGVRTRGSMMAPLQPQQLSQLALRPVPLAAPALVQATPPMPQAPPILNVPLDVPPQLLTQPLPRPDPRQTPTQANPQLDPCIQIVYDGGVKIDLKAVATGPSSVNLTWSGFPGHYDLSTAGAGAGFHAATDLLPIKSRQSQPQMVQGTLTHAPTLPGFQYNYAITGTLTDGRKACGAASATTLPAPLTGQAFLPPVTLEAPAPLWGWVDLHTHPMSNLAFGGKLFHGGPDEGSLLPAVQMPYDPQCRFDVRATNIFEALSDDAPTHGDAVQSKCGNFIRNLLIIEGIEGMTKGGLKQPGHAVGAPTFANWPKWNDVTHQKMWWEWIKRAHAGGLRVMVALSHNNRTLGDVVGPGNFVSMPPGSPISGPTNDMASSDLQIAEIKAFVLRHSTDRPGQPAFMDLAYSAADVYRIVQANKIAIVLGVEIDNIGNFNQRVITPGLIESEIQRLYSQGVRYIFPIHLTDNVFGDTAIYDPLFNLANVRETGKFWKVECAAAGDEIGFKSPNVNVPAPFNQFIPAGVPLPQSPPCWVPTVPAPTFLGHRNGRTATGLTPFGETAIKAMMKIGMIIDIDHMSNRAAERALQIAEGIDMGRGYPLMSGHSGIRARDVEHSNAENSRTRAQLVRIGCLQGMFGLGTDGADAYDWARQYVDAFTEMNKPFSAQSQCPNKVSFGPGSVAFGTDTNSLVKSPRPTAIVPPPLARNSVVYNNAFPRSQTGTKTWDYNLEGVAHYGMYADFVKDVRTAPVNQGMNGADLVDNHLMRSADYFWRMWQKIEAQKVKVP